jgi:hypothetical protein
MNQFPSGLLIVALLSTVIPAQSRWDRSKALRSLRSCANHSMNSGCDEDASQYLVELYNRGDHRLLEPLVNAGSYSDGALSEVLADFYSDMLWKRPGQFLEALSSHSAHNQRTDCMLASQMGGDQLLSVRRSLRNFSSAKYGRLSKVARTCLAEINRANASNAG